MGDATTGRLVMGMLVATFVAIGTVVTGESLSEIAGESKERTGA